MTIFWLKTDSNFLFSSCDSFGQRPIVTAQSLGEPFGQRLIVTWFTLAEILPFHPKVHQSLHTQSILPPNPPLPPHPPLPPLPPLAIPAYNKRSEDAPDFRFTAPVCLRFKKVPQCPCSSCACPSCQCLRDICICQFHQNSGNRINKYQLVFG